MKYSTIKVDGDVVVARPILVDGDVNIAKPLLMQGNIRIANRVQGNSYRPLIEKPAINNRILESGNNTYEYLGIEPTIIDITEQDIDDMIYGG